MFSKLQGNKKQTKEFKANRKQKSIVTHMSKYFNNYIKYKWYKHSNLKTETRRVELKQSMTQL